jgi:hypothetical protein
MAHKLTDHLTVTDDQYEAAAAALTARGLNLTRGWFLDPKSWTVIPDGTGRASKAEMCVNKPAGLLPGRTMLNLWLAPDIRRPGMAWPHGHPAEFESEIVYGGGYTEMRYGRNASGVWSAEHRYRLGERNTFPLDFFHEVVDVAAGALSVMRWGDLLRPGGWGNLNVESGEFALTAPDPVFLAHLAALNPQHPNRWT